MKLQVNHYGRVRGGEIIYAIPELMRQELAALEGKDVIITIKKKHEKASTNQYGYYRGGILGTCYKSNHFAALDTKDQIHELYFAPKFLTYKKLVEISGVRKEVTVTRSLADLSVEEMSEFLEKVLAECAHLGIEVLPAEMYYSRFYSK